MAPLSRQGERKNCHGRTYARVKYVMTHFRPDRPRSFRSAPKIATSGKSDFLSMRREFVSYSKPIRFVRLDSEHAQCDGKFLNFLCWTFPEVLTKKSVASGKENG